MADHLDLVAQKWQRLEEAVDFGVKRYCGTEVPDVIEIIGGVKDLGGGIRIPLPADFG